MFPRLCPALRPGLTEARRGGIPHSGKTPPSSVFPIAARPPPRVDLGAEVGASIAIWRTSVAPITGRSSIHEDCGAVGISPTAGQTETKWPCGPDVWRRRAHLPPAPAHSALSCGKPDHNRTPQSFVRPPRSSTMRCRQTWSANAARGAASVPIEKGISHRNAPVPLTEGDEGLHAWCLESGKGYG